MTDLAAIIARISALPVTPGAGMILASRDDILQAITGTAPGIDSIVHTTTPTACCEYCGGAPVAEELSGYPMLNFVGDRAQAEAACAAYLTTYRGWVVTATEARCGTCVGIDFTVEV